MDMAPVMTTSSPPSSTQEKSKHPAHCGVAAACFRPLGITHKTTVTHHPALAGSTKHMKEDLDEHDTKGGRFGCFILDIFTRGVLDQRTCKHGVIDGRMKKEFRSCQHWVKPVFRENEML